jgi:SAM-dependent methyltransferase
MDLSYAKYYRRLYEEHWWWRAREAFVLDRIRSLFGTGDIGPILDVGCGDGLFFPKLREFGTPEGIEIDPAALGGKRPAQNIHLGPFDQTFQPGKTYRMILMLDVVEHVRDDVAFLERALELLAPDGHILITVPALQWIWTHHDDLNHHLRRYTRKRLAAVAGAAGMEIEESRYFFLWTVPVKLMERLRGRFFGPGPHLPVIPPAPVNAALIALSRAEHVLLGRLRVPLGSSLFVTGCVKRR